MHMHISQDGRAISWNSYCTSLRAISRAKNNKVKENYITNEYSNELVRAKEECKVAKSLIVTRFSNSSVNSSKLIIHKNNISTKSSVIDNEKFNRGHKRPYMTNNGCYTCESKKLVYRKDVQLFYVFHNPFNRAKEPQDAQESDVQERCKCTTPCQDNRLNDENKALKRIVRLFAESNECKCIGDKLKQLVPQIDRINPECSCIEVETQACRGKCLAKKLKRLIPRNTDHKLMCACAKSGTQTRDCTCTAKGRKTLIRHKNEPKVDCVCAAETQARVYGGQGQRTEKESFNRERGTSCVCGRQKNYLKQSIPQRNVPQPPRTSVEAKTQSPSYGGSYQRAGRESFYREIGTSEIPNYKYTPNPIEEVGYGSSHDLFDEYKPATINRRVGCNSRYNPKCCNYVPRDTQKLAQSSTYCKLDNINNERGVITILCNMMLQPTNIFPGSKNCCKNRRTICQGDDKEGVLKKFCELLIEPKNINNNNNKYMTDAALAPRKSRGALRALCARDGKKSIKKLCQVLLNPNSYKNKARKITGAEVMTQSRSYGGRQQRAGREIFCRNRGTCGAPNPKKQKEEYEEIIEEFPTCVDCRPAITNKTVGIGTNVKFYWYKDRHAYGEPKPQCDLKGAIEQWNEVPLRQAGTKTGASLNCDTGVNFYNTNAATQSRKYQGRHLRAGRETFYRDAQTSYVSKNNKNKFEGNSNVINQSCLPSPDRKAIRWGSNCSFSLEISKDNPPDSTHKSPCGDKIDANKNKKTFYSKYIRQLVTSQFNERQTGDPSKSDACTCTDCSPQGNNECQCENLKQKSQRRPLHIGSKVSYHFNFAKSISPKTESQMAQEPYVKSSRQERIATICDATSPECELVPDSKKIEMQAPSQVVNSTEDSDLESNVSPEKIINTKAIRENLKSAKECFIKLMSKENFRRLIKGEQIEIQKLTPDQQRLQALLRPPRNVKNTVCPAQCSRICQPAEKSDQPMRMGSSFSFDYNMHNVKPKRKRNVYEEKFLKLEDFSGSVTKMNLFRLIIGKLRKRKSKPGSIGSNATISVTCDPIECRKRKRENKSWFSYILENIKQEKQLSTSFETDTKNLFSGIIFKNLKKRKPKGEPLILSSLKSQLKETIIPSTKKSTRSFVSLMLSRSDKGRRKRRRRRGSSYSTSYLDDIETCDIDTLASSILPPSRSSRSDENYPPCQITSECCFECNYNKLDESDNETGTTKSTIDSRNYATT